MRHRAAAKSTYHSTREGKHRVTMTLLNQISERTTFSYLSTSNKWELVVICTEYNYLKNWMFSVEQYAMPTPDASTEIQKQNQAPAYAVTALCMQRGDRGRSTSGPTVTRN